VEYRKYRLTLAQTSKLPTKGISLLFYSQTTDIFRFFRIPSGQT